jgi:O-6-methylguanine DNA methyltransferase
MQPLSNRDSLRYSPDGTAQLSIAGASYADGGRGAHILYAMAGFTLPLVPDAVTQRFKWSSNAPDRQRDLIIDWNGSDERTLADPSRVRFLIATTHSGVCWIGIHRSPDRLEAELRADFPHATVMRDESSVGDFADQIVAYIRGDNREIDLPVDLRATPFQLSVWRELCAIPAGTTRSYGTIAHRLGTPAASRAVGRANATNPLAVLIPCHRAIATNGELTGYRWGLEYKRCLLEYEAALADQPK